MSPDPHWSRRQFLLHSAAAAALSSNRLLLSQAARPQSAAASPEEILGDVRPLLHGNTALPLRYQPVNRGFVIRNGSEFFNRPLYGANIAFRVDAGDRPEFSLYLPGHGGNLRLAVSIGETSFWLHQAEEIVATYRDGLMHYRIADPHLHGGSIEVQSFTVGNGSGLQLIVTPTQLPPEARLLCAFGGVSGRRGKRGGDIGCESEPVAQFFQLRPEECTGNIYTVSAPSPVSPVAVRVQAHAATLDLSLPPGTQTRIADATNWNTPPETLWRSATETTPKLPILLASTVPDQPLHLHLFRVDVPHSTAPLTPLQALAQNQLQTEAATRIATLAETAHRLQASTPDAFIDAAASALSTASDALWDEAAGCVMHGAVAWRVPLAGWRGPYCLSSLGWHERFQRHSRHWLARQNISPVTTTGPVATGHPDPGSHLARTENLLHSQGDLSHNHYDMNLVFFDALIRHLRWTGDRNLAREAWPALQRHLAWEQRLFRRAYQHNGDELPLYEAYAAIWASDNLQYNGGGVAHSTAYNLFAHEAAAHLATLLGEDAAPYAAEATLIRRALTTLLWIAPTGSIGESKDILAQQTVYTSPALWTVYHTIDSEAVTPLEAWQMAAERLYTLPHVPVHGADVPSEQLFQLACSDWLPYIWSLNLLLLAENMHFALALWQAGDADNAYRIFKGNLLDSLFQGLSPGNFHMTSPLDVHRQEAQRDFGDPIGISSRAFVEGLFGVQPNLLSNTIVLRPGFPSHWSHASLHHIDFDLAWQRSNSTETLHFTSRLQESVPVTLLLRAPRTGTPRVHLDGKPIAAIWLEDAIGAPTLKIVCPASRSLAVEIVWAGAPAPAIPQHQSYPLHAPLHLPAGISLSAIHDPQHCLRNGHAVSPGVHTIFARMHHGSCRWLLPITFTAAAAPLSAAPLALTAGERIEPLDLTPHLQHHLRQIFQRDYDSPRSSFCSLSIPRQGIGAWAAFDTQPVIDDSGLRSLPGELTTPQGLRFRIPAHDAPNCRFLSLWQQDDASLQLSLEGSATALHLLLTGSTFPQTSRMTHATVTVHYASGEPATLALRNPETWWPIEQDYLFDDYLFTNDAPLPTRVDLRTAKVRILDRPAFKGKGTKVEGGAATILSLPLDSQRELRSLEIKVELYGPVLALIALSLTRSQSELRAASAKD
ncbi:MAG: DUF4450 domain-containing protein [Edaphobacter sp.]|uniref:DUF4450 domain-containing protein n=1 Tax=Edaphobacter sp. TaxID=1934404 RepID=UPI0023A0C635|nr:DUF4450 domain-containing protein [Edaphobacter sp.]MDE1177162.1 DUF4450 domain-containing protein [Edaphobacter sp.]